MSVFRFSVPAHFPICGSSLKIIFFFLQNGYLESEILRFIRTCINQTSSHSSVMAKVDTKMFKSKKDKSKQGQDLYRSAGAAIVLQVLID